MPASIPAVDIASPKFKSNPYPFYARLRSEAPVHRVTLPDRQFAWLISRYDDVAAVLKDERFAKNKAAALTTEQAAKQPWVPAMFRPLTRNMLDLDPPDHTRLRALVHRAFTPRLVELMRDRIQSLADDAISAARKRGGMDLLRDYALPIPTTIIGEMLGVPDRDRHRFHRWTRTIVAANPSGWGMLKAIPSAIAFLRYIRRLVASRRRDPRDDLLGSLVQAEESGEKLSEDELVAMIFLLLVAGHETTVNLIGNGMLALLKNPGQMERLKADPMLIKSAVEELLRYDSPLATATERYAREDVPISGLTIPRGGLVYPVIASANRDEHQFPDADSLDITREPNRHLSFGFGPHFCLGAPLARMEGKIAIGTIVNRLPGLCLAVDPDSLRWRRGLVLRGLEALPVTFKSR